MGRCTICSFRKSNPLKKANSHSTQSPAWARLRIALGAALSLAAAAVLMVPISCEHTATPTHTYPTVTPTTPAEHTYTTRGILIRLPGKDKREVFQIHHEEIKEFKDKNDKVIGMHEMIMPFEDISPKANFAGLSPGDKVSMTFEVRWKSDPTALVVAISKLPPETQLNLSPEAKPPQ